jgi:hypothetical protein
VASGRSPLPVTLRSPLVNEGGGVGWGPPSGITFGRGGRGVVRLTQGSNGGSPVTRNDEIDPGDNDHPPPPKMT